MTINQEHFPTYKSLPPVLRTQTTYPLSEGTKVLVTLLPDEDERGFWLGVSEHFLAKIWENAEDDIYAELL